MALPPLSCIFIQMPQIRQNSCSVEDEERWFLSFLYNSKIEFLFPLFTVYMPTYCPHITCSSYPTLKPALDLGRIRETQQLPLLLTPCSQMVFVLLFSLITCAVTVTARSSLKKQSYISVELTRTKIHLSFKNKVHTDTQYECETAGVFLLMSRNNFYACMLANPHANFLLTG